MARVSPKNTNDATFQELFLKARAAGLEAVNKLSVEPMVICEHKNLLDDTSPVTKRYVIADGPCGFGWINVRPGNCAFALWLKKKGYVQGAAYEGGVNIWVSEFRQSLAKKEAYAFAFAQVLNEAGIRAYGSSRID
jgi:hypothetical protein